MQESNPEGSSNFRQYNQFSSTVIKLLEASCTDSTWKQYRSVMNSWKEFCSVKSFSIVPSVNTVLQFLAELYDKGRSYISINTSRSALSTIYGSIEGYPIGSHPLVSRLMKGIKNKRPIRPKYAQTWDLGSVLALFQNWNSNDQLNLHDLSMKCSSLLALSTGQRVQTLSLIRVDNIKFLTDGSVDIVIVDKLKSGSNVVLSLPVFKDKKLCVVNVLQSYMNCTSDLRSGEFLFVSTRPPYNCVSTQTLSRWLKCILGKAGIDTELYSAHSFRHASTSKAFEKGVPIDSIYKAAGWSKKSCVFFKHYNRQIVDKHKFANEVINALNK